MRQFIMRESWQSIGRPLDELQASNWGIQPGHTTEQTGGWVCRNCHLIICNSCAEDEVSRTGRIE
jgi:hypothetical protein